jgi:heterodisulfide reductase subunit A2
LAFEGRTHKPVIDYDRCETCAVCLQACPAELAPELRREDESLRGRIYGHSDTESRLNPGKTFGPPRCQAACPIAQDVRGYMHLVFEGRYREALQLIRETNPLPSVCGYICHHPCEQACTRAWVDDPLSIRSLKRFVADYDDGTLLPPARQEVKNRKVVIIGSGPAGLTAAHELSRKGYEVEVIESHKKPGGMLAWAIPSFRLPRNVLERDIEYIRKMGVEIKTGISFGHEIALEDIRKEGAHAVIIATGTQGSLKMNVQNENGVSGYLDCLTFLRKYNSGESTPLGNRILVVGGGNAAIDTARSALRAEGRKVSLIYRRTLEQMPAHRDEVEEALREGVEILFLTAPIKILVAGGRLRGLECVKTELHEADAGGRKRPVPVKGSQFEIPADTLISAVGQQPEYGEISKALSLEGKAVEINSETMETVVDGVFAAGDFINGPTTVVEAMASGKKAAQAVEAYLKEK